MAEMIVKMINEMGNATTDVPAKLVKAYEGNGWKLAPEKKAESPKKAKK